MPFGLLVSFVIMIKVPILLSLLGFLAIIVSIQNCDVLAFEKRQSKFHVSTSSAGCILLNGAHIQVLIKIILVSLTNI